VRAKGLLAALRNWPLTWPFHVHGRPRQSSFRREGRADDLAELEAELEAKMEAEVEAEMETEARPEEGQLLGQRSAGAVPSAARGGKNNSQPTVEHSDRQTDTHGKLSANVELVSQFAG